MDLPQNELDMSKKEVKPEYKYVERLYATSPLLGDTIVSDSALKKINEQAKKCIDAVVDNPSVQLPSNAHLFITLATVNYAKKWNSFEESKFTKYVSMQFGYKDETGRIWSVISKSIEKALDTKHRFFLRDKGGREFYESVLVHSFGPENAWDSIFDLLFDFLKYNLRWDYISGDPIILKMVSVLKNRFDGNSNDDDELVISSTEYRIRLGARRLIQNRPVYTANLFDHMLGRINGLIHNETSEPKTYSDVLIDEWFARKISRMVDREKRQITRVTRTAEDMALSYSKIRTRILMMHGRLWIHVPSIRLENTNAELAEVKIYNDEKIVGLANLEIYGNELGETISEKDVPINTVNSDSFNLTVKIICDGEVIYNSGKSLWRKLIAFNGTRECNINSLKVGTYEMYIPEPDELQLSNATVTKQSDKYVEVKLHDNFSVSYYGKIIVMDTSNINNTEIVDPLFVQGCAYISGTDKYDITQSDDFYKIFLDKDKNGDSIRLIVNDKKYNLSSFAVVEENGTAIYEIPVDKIFERGHVAEVMILDMEAGITLYKRAFLVVESLHFSFNHRYYIQDDDYIDAELHYEIDQEKGEHRVNSTDSVISHDYYDGQIEFYVPKIDYEWLNLSNMYPGNCIWVEDITKKARLLVNNRSELEVEVEFGKYRSTGHEIDLFHLVNKDKDTSQYDCAINICIGKEKYCIARVIYSEMFTKAPSFTMEENRLFWDGGINYIGNKEDTELCLQLYDSQEEKRYELMLSFDESFCGEIDDFEDNEYTFLILNSGNGSIIAQDVQFFGNPNKSRFKDKTIEIDFVTEDVETRSKRIEIKPVFIDKVRFVKRDYVPSEDDIFDIYEGRMYFQRFDGSKKIFSTKYVQKGNISFYQVNPVQIIYINDTYIRVINPDDEGLYCYDNVGSTPRFEMTDREPPKGARNYKDVLFYCYQIEQERGKRVEKLVIVPQPVLPVKTSVLDSFEVVSQENVVKAPKEARILLNAGPGTGKTWTLIERIINLVGVEGVDPEEILVLCFSKAAVEVIKSRLAMASEEGRVSDVINYVDVRTFDSFASQLLYWVKESDDYDILEYYNIGKLNYDERISLFTNVIREAPELIEQCSHLFVDEVQDLVRDRARMVIEMIRQIPEESGITLLGDSCQSIYDYQVLNDNMDSVKFYKCLCEDVDNFEYYTLERNHRQTDSLAAIGDGYRKRILSGNASECDLYWDDNISAKIEKYDVYNSDDIGEGDMDKLLQEGTVGILTRTNGQALKISAALRKKGIDHLLKKRLSDNALHMWIALVFNELDHLSVEYSDFVEILDDLQIPGVEDNCEDAWVALQESARTSADHIGIRDVMKGLYTGAKNPILFSMESEQPLTVTSIHRGKGREFDTVLVEDSIFSEEKRPIDEHKVSYVAITRPKNRIYRISSKSTYMSIDKDGDRRCFEAKFGRNGKRHLANIEMGFSYDINQRSFVCIDGVQEFIRDNYSELVGEKVVLVKDNHFSEYVRYDIYVPKYGMMVGWTGKEFYLSLTRIIRKIYNLPNGITPYFKVFPERIVDIYVEDITSVVDQGDGSEIGVKRYGEYIAWNVISIVGYGKVEYT